MNDNISELLKPRCILTTNYPMCPYKVGEIFIKTFHPDNETWYWRCAKFSDNDMPRDYPEKYPHLFKKIEWWEERKEEDIKDIGFVKWNEIGYMGGKMDVAGNIEPVRSFMKYLKTWVFKVDSQFNDIRAEYFTPATEKEYESYINQTKQNNP